jgi:hypothetical protein
MDAIHVACALAWAADLFASSDLRQVHGGKGGGNGASKTLGCWGGS